jgi:integrase
VALIYETEGQEGELGDRRGWREKIEPGIYRNHRLACDSSSDHKPGRRCACPLLIVVPGEGGTKQVPFRGTPAQARRERHRRMGEGKSRGAREVAAPAGSLHELASSFFTAKAPVLAPSTIKGYNEAYRMRVAPTLGALPLEAVTREQVEVWLAELVSTTSAHATWKAVKSLRAILKAGVEWGHIDTNPAARLQLPKREVEVVQAERVLDEDQYERLIATASRNLRIETMLRMAGEVGLRRGEIMGLRWGDLDLGARRVTVSRTVWQARGRGSRQIISRPKGGRTRRVSMPATLAEKLGEWRDATVAKTGQEAVADDAYVWPGRGGKPIGDGTPRQALQRMEEDAGLVDAEGKPLVTFHGLRHTCGSIMLAAGVPIISVSRQLGHASVAVTDRVYAHLVDRDRQLDEAVSVFDKRRASAAN